MMIFRNVGNYTVTQQLHIPEDLSLRSHTPLPYFPSRNTERLVDSGISQMEENAPTHEEFSTLDS
jgi:hypothetical protein